MEEKQEIEGKQSDRVEETPFEAFASICSVLVLGLFALTFIFQNFEIPSSSMEKTLLIGDHVLVDRSTLAPEAKWMPLVNYRNIRRGDIIVFFKPTVEPNGEHLYLVKRVVGIPGDHIHLVNGTVFLNGQAQVEPQTAKSPYYSPYRDDFPAVPPTEDVPITAAWSVDLPSYVHGGDLVVPPGKYFAMGDNRPNSLDSRYWGFVPRENIVGRPLFVYWSFVTPEDQVDKTGMGDRAAFFVHIVTHFLSDTRWNRTLHLVR